jgi:hypothetical protein
MKKETKLILGAGIKKDGEIPYLRIATDCYSASEVVDILDNWRRIKNAISNLVVIESHEESGCVWIVSFSGTNPEEAGAVFVSSRSDAFKLVDLLKSMVS